jgi:hypothetical protein
VASVKVGRAVLRFPVRPERGGLMDTPRLASIVVNRRPAGACKTPPAAL